MELGRMGDEPNGWKYARRAAMGSEIGSCLWQIISSSCSDSAKDWEENFAITSPPTWRGLRVPFLNPMLMVEIQRMRNFICLSCCKEANEGMVEVGEKQSSYLRNCLDCLSRVGIAFPVREVTERENGKWNEISRQNGKKREIRKRGTWYTIK